jgi:predicted AAA+ superfamily ATPase
MAVSNRDRVRKGLDSLRDGLVPFVEREMQRVYGPDWQTQAQAGLPGLPPRQGPIQGQMPVMDTSRLLNIVLDQWQPVFKDKLSPFERGLIHELRNARNLWAHEQPISTDDAYRALDNASRLLQTISAGDQAAEVDRERQEMLRVRFDEQARRETRRAAGVALEGQPAGGLKPWREVVTPHPDVASGRYQQAEFAADLAQVHRGEGADEYRDPREFFARTFLTEGLKHLLANALRRLGTNGGDPVIKLQTNFGGGKTHSMLALYHLFSGTPAGDLAGVESVVQAAGLQSVPSARRAVLVGTALSPSEVRRKLDGTEVRTLWGELAWQLGEARGYAMVADADRQGVSPGSDTLRELFATSGPCLVLIDEWVAYARNLYGAAGPGGSFDANLTFAQALTEAARAAPNTLIVASIPSSQIEVGGEAGRMALTLLENTFARVESAWRPASAEEGFEIVRRRLFGQLQDYTARDAVARAFGELYRSQPGEFPPGCREGDYERRLKAAYPIHPELFDRLYEDWSSLERFQRTRGVLRLMAAVIHGLWERQDKSLLILPASIPIDDPAVQEELTRYLEDAWKPVIEKDVDGPHSLPLQIDRDNPNLMRYSATRRVARTAYMGSAPKLQAANRGIDDRQVKLGCVQPGENAAIFGDALRRLGDQATFLYADAGRYWYALQPNVTRTAADRAEQLAPHLVREEIVRRLKEQQGRRGDFVKVYPCPASFSDVPDEPEARLVILAPEHPRASSAGESAGRKAAAAMLEQRSGGSRTYRNALVFLAADPTRLHELEQAVRQFLAWQTIEKDHEALNLDAHQTRQAEDRRKQYDETVKQRIPETYQWLLVPTQPDPRGAVVWEEVRVQGDEPLAERASKKLKNEELLITQLAGTRLRIELDKVPLWRGDDVNTRQLWEDFATYPYLPRLKDPDVVAQAIRDGIQRLTWDDTFAYAEGWDEQRQRYLGLRAGEGTSVLLDRNTLVVKPDAAQRQLDADDAARRERERQITGVDTGTDGGSDTTGTGTGTVEPEPEAQKKVPRRFFGTVHLDPLRVGRDASSVAQEVVQHLSGLVGAEAEITLEIQVRIPDGVPDHVVRTVAENCRVLKFASAEFESS